MRVNIILIAACLFAAITSTAQVKIGGTGTPNTNAVLELDGGTNKGLLLPRLTSTQMTAMTSAPDGMIVYNTTTYYLYIRKNGSWEKMLDNTNGTGFSLPYSGGVNNGVSFYIYNSDNTNVNSAAIFGNGDAGIGVTGTSGTGRGGYFSSTSGVALTTGTGNVGIGTNTPSQKLDIANGRLRFTGNPSGSISQGIEFTNNAGTTLNGFVGQYNDSIIGMYGFTGAGWQFLWNGKNGNLGLQGNNNPRAALSFANSGGNKIALYGNAETPHYGLGIGTGLLQMYCANVTDNIAFGYGSSTAFNEVMRIKGNGNVGIGTTSPTSKLLIVDATTQSSALFISKVGSSGNGIGVVNNNTSSAILAENYGSGAAITTGGTGGGKIGVNNSSPQASLSFDNAVGNKMDLYYSSANSRYGLGLQAALLQMYTGGSGDDIAFGYGSSTAFTENMRIKGNGNVGIGTATPNSELQVNGSFSLPIVTFTNTDYAVSDNDYTVYYTATSNTNTENTIWLPSPVGRKGRIYHIKCDIPASGPSDFAGITWDKVWLKVLGTSTSVIPSLGNSVQYFCNFSYYKDYGSGFVSHYSYSLSTITVQSDGSSWKIVSWDKYSGA